MATITLDYNTRNAQAQKALNYVLSLGFFKVQPVNNLRRRKIGVNLKAHSGSEDPFAEVRGIWAGREIDAKALRKEAWRIKND